MIYLNVDVYIFGSSHPAVFCKKSVLKILKQKSSDISREISSKTSRKFPSKLLQGNAFHYFSINSLMTFFSRKISKYSENFYSKTRLDSQGPIFLNYLIARLLKVLTSNIVNRWRRSGVLIINSQHNVLVFPLLNLDK